MKPISLTLAAIAAWTAAASVASAQSRPAAWVNRIIVEWDEIQLKEGWVPVGQIRPGSLATGAEEKIDYPLAAGASYRFVVVCEPGCGAGEVELLDPAGGRVGDPKPLAEMPKLQAAPAAAGTFRLRVAMTDCSSETCAYSARMYAKRPTKSGRAKSDK